MANFIASKHEANDFNNGIQYVGQNDTLGIAGDKVKAQDMNNIVESTLYSQEMAETAIANASEALEKIEDVISTTFDHNGTYPNLTVGSLPFVVCDTDSTEQNKIVTMLNFTLKEGARITVLFNYANTANMPTLNVNGTGAKKIIADNDSEYVKWINSTIMEFVYVQNAWLCLSGYALKGKGVGFVEIRYDSGSPADIYGGSWEKIAEGKTLIGASSNYLLGSEGGSTTHFHTLEHGYAEIAMKQTSSAYWTRKYTPSTYQPNHRSRDAAIFSEFSEYPVGEATALGGRTDSADHLPPYLAVNIWKRIA